MKLTLFTGPQCHLCDVAMEVIHSMGDASVEVEKVNIRDNADHYHLYAVRIPGLLRHDNQKELGWPFDKQQLELFLS